MIGAQIPVTGQVDLLEMQPSYGDFLGASLEMGWMRNPVPSWLRYMDREEARGKDTLDYMHDPGIQSLYRTLGLTGKRDPNDLSPMVPKSQLNEIYGRIGLNFKNDERVEVAAMIATQKERENRLQELQKRAESKRTYGTGFLAEMAAGIADPLNIASAFIPVVGQARYASMLARYGATTARAARGLVEGAVGAALVEPLVLLGATDEQADYTAMDSLLNVAFGGILGGGLHTGLGAIKDLRAARTGQLSEAQTAHVLDMVERERAKREPAPQNEVAAKFDSLSPDEKANVLRAAVGALEDGKRTYVGDFLAAPLVVREAKAPSSAALFDPGPIDGSLYRDYSGVRSADRRWIEGVIAELDQTERGHVTRREVDGQGNHYEYTGVKATTPEWFQTYNKDTASILTREKARAVADKMIAGKPLGKEEIKIAETIHNVARDNRERNVAQMTEFRQDRQARQDAEIDAIAAREALDGAHALSNDPRQVNTADFEAARDADTKLTLRKEADDAAAQFADLEGEISEIMARVKPLQENLGIKDDLLKAADDAIKQAKSEAQAYQIAAACKLGL